MCKILLNLFFIFLKMILGSAGIRRMRYSDLIEQDFYQWLADNFREITAQPSTDPDFFNHLRISSKDGMYHKGKKLDIEDMNIIKNAESIVIVCDKRNTHPIVIPPLLLEVKTVKSLFLKNIIIPAHTATNTKMEILEEIELHSCTIYDLTTLVPKNSSLKKLILHDCDIKNCWLDTEKVPLLDTLIINNSNLHSINKEVFMLPNLNRIDLKNNQILFLPVFYDDDIPITKELILRRNRLLEYPKQLNQFKNLEFLDLSFNFIEKFGENFVEGLSLENLNLEGNAIKELPEGMENLIDLQYLNLSYNEMEECRIEIFQLPNLERLNLSFNSFKKLDETISLFSRGIYDVAGLTPGEAPYKLKELDLSYNFLTTIPLSFGCFESLKFLNLDGNLLFSIPSAIYNLSNLEILKLSYNRIKYIPCELAKLPFLFELYLNGGQDFRNTTGPTNQINLVPKALLNRKSGMPILIYLKNNILFDESTVVEYGREEIERCFKSQVIF